MQNCQQSKKPVFFFSFDIFTLSLQGPQLSTSCIFVVNYYWLRKRGRKHLRINLPRRKTSVNNSRSDCSCSRDHIVASSSSLLQDKFLNLQVSQRDRGRGLQICVLRKHLILQAFHFLHCTAVCTDFKNSRVGARESSYFLERTTALSPSLPGEIPFAISRKKKLLFSFGGYEKIARQKVNTEAHGASNPFFSSNHTVSLYSCTKIQNIEGSTGT